ncbi:hypothetical protein [Acetobacterium sp.]|uniref:hypothetical protein n=1 Tax=Acetobacterium sp. TaxID=1872094 RepID=UPI00359439E4
MGKGNDHQPPVKGLAAFAHIFGDTVTGKKQPGGVFKGVPQGLDAGLVLLSNFCGGGSKAV